MGDGLAIVFAVLALLVALCVGLAGGALIGAILLRASVSLSNLIADRLNSPVVVREPPMIPAMGIALVTQFINSLLGVVVAVMGWGLVHVGETRQLSAYVQAELISLAISAPITAGLLAYFLRTSFWRGLLVYLCEILIVATILGAVALAILSLRGS